MLNNIQKHVAIKSSLIDNTLLKYAFVTFVTFVIVVTSSIDSFYGFRQ